jgi:hypothetical protein
MAAVMNTCRVGTAAEMIQADASFDFAENPVVASPASVGLVAVASFA